MIRIFWALAGATTICFVALAVWSAWAISGEAWWQPIFDARIGGYGSEDAQYFLMGLSPEGLAAYRGPFRVADTGFPVLLAATLALGLWLHLGRRVAVVLGVIAVCAAWLDLKENSAVAGLLALGPDRIDAEIVRRASTLTVLKWICYLVALAGLGLGLFLRKRA